MVPASRVEDAGDAQPDGVDRAVRIHRIPTGGDELADNDVGASFGPGGSLIGPDHLGVATGASVRITTLMLVPPKSSPSSRLNPVLARVQNRFEAVALGCVNGLGVFQRLTFLVDDGASLGEDHPVDPELEQPPFHRRRPAGGDPGEGGGDGAAVGGEAVVERPGGEVVVEHELAQEGWMAACSIAIGTPSASRTRSTITTRSSGASRVPRPRPPWPAGGPRRAPPSRAPSPGGGSRP